MKKTLILVLLLLAMAALIIAGCGGGSNDTTPATEPPAATTPAATEPPAPAVSALVGEWDWEGLGVYYTFEADGTGRRGSELLPDLMEYFDWSAENGVLYITVTEGFVEGFTEEWNYTIVGNQLDIDSRQVPGIAWSYTRVS